MTNSFPNLPLIYPATPRLSTMTDGLQTIERRAIYSNNGPVNQEFEQALSSRLFDDQGVCVTVANATVALMMGLREAVPEPCGRYALMPSFTFAATAQAALWAGLTPLLCDIDQQTWLLGQDAEDALLARYGDAIAVIMPCTTFANAFDVARYDHIARTRGIPFVVDAAGALGSLDHHGRQVGAGETGCAIFSCHATKPFALTEGGVIHVTDPRRAETFRRMANFGFGAERRADYPGLNGKLDEITALMGLRQLDGFAERVAARQTRADLYAALLPELAAQHPAGRRQAYAFATLLLPPDLAAARDTIRARLAAHGIGTGAYYSPHVADQPYLAERSVSGPLQITADIAARILALPAHERITNPDIHFIADTLRQAIHHARQERT